jgi:hypothetical protein
MPDGIQSTVRLFADDTIAYVTISSDADAANLQQDLDKLAEWESKWLIQRNVMYSSSPKSEVHLRDRPFNLKGGGYGFLLRSEFFFEQHKSWIIYFFCRAKCEFFFQIPTLGYMTKTLESDFFFSSTKIRIFFSATLGIRIFF